MDLDKEYKGALIAMAVADVVKEHKIDEDTTIVTLMGMVHAYSHILGRTPDQMDNFYKNMTKAYSEAFAIFNKDLPHKHEN